MPEIFDITLPKLGESIVSATVVNWLKKVGDRVALDEPLLEVATDKVNSEIPSPVAGVLTEIIVSENDPVEVGGVLAKIELTATTSHTPHLKVDAPSQSCVAHSSPCRAGIHQGLFSPAVLRLAQQEGISIEVLRQIEGTGAEGRVSKKDLEEFVKSRTSPSPISHSQPVAAAAPLEERIALSGMRKAIAENMIRSFYEAPHASLVQEADVTDILSLIAREKERFFQTHGAKLTITSFLIYALSRTVQNYPMINAFLDNETIVMKRYVNVGMAVNVPGGLIVPVIKQCHERTLVSIAKAAGEIAQKARDGKLALDEIADGTITLSNFGMTGAIIGIPIIRHPEVAIIGVGTIQKRVVVREDDSLAIRKMIYLTLTFDHRVIDGIYGCDFLKSFKDHLESFPFEG